MPRARTASPPDEEVVDLSASANPADAAHGKVWRMSQAVDTGSLGGAPQSPHMDGVAGETGALNDAGRGPVTTPNFYGELEFKSVTGDTQDDLAFSVQAAAFDQRHGFVRIFDDGAGFDLTFFDTVEDGFNGTTLELNLGYDAWHTLGIEIVFMDGFTSGDFGDSDVIGNDVVNIYVNDALVHTGTSWESFYAAVQDHAESVDTLMITASSSGAGSVLPDQLGGGLYFDNVLVTDVRPAVEAPAPATLALLGLGLAALGARARARD